MGKPRLLLSLAICVLILLTGGAMAGQKNTFKSINDVSLEKWQTLSAQKIYFGHQSVGFNIIDGIKDIMSANNKVQLNIVELNKIGRLEVPGFYHSRIGSNVDPISKIDDFSHKMAGGIGGSADIEFLKFCFVDIGADTDVNKVFDHYKNTMLVLKAKYPGTTFVHFTVPLGTTIESWKTKIKVLMGKKDIWEYDANIKKNEFNDLLREYYAGNEPVFDIARSESTYPDKKRSTFTKNGKLYYDLAPEYTYDDGHLNEKGRKRVAEQLLIFLAEL